MSSQYAYAQAALKEIDKAQGLAALSTRYYNGGQTVREETPTDNEVARAQVHATLAVAYAELAAGAPHD